MSPSIPERTWFGPPWSARGYAHRPRAIELAKIRPDAPGGRVTDEAAGERICPKHQSARNGEAGAARHLAIVIAASANLWLRARSLRATGRRSMPASCAKAHQMVDLSSKPFLSMHPRM